MKCPLCNKEMNQIQHEGFSLENPMTMTEMQECECGLVYEYAYGAERYIKDGKELKDI